jgi:hypothetical protein
MPPTDITQLISYNRESQPLNEFMMGIDKNSYTSTLPKRTGIPHGICSSQALRVFGYSTSASGKLCGIIKAVGTIGTKSEGSTVCCGDLMEDSQGIV